MSEHQEKQGTNRPDRKSGENRQVSKTGRKFDSTEGKKPSGNRKPDSREDSASRKYSSGDRPSRQGETIGKRYSGEEKPFNRGKNSPRKYSSGDRPSGQGENTGKRYSGGKTEYRRGGGKPAGRGPAGSWRTGPYGRPAPRKPAPKKPAEPEGMIARRAALKVIREVTEEGAYASLSLDRALQGSGMSGADRRLASRLAYDTLDHLGYLDHMISQVMAREDTDIKLRNILRLGACQILLEDRIPESAATNTCVQLCVEIGMEGLKGVCNGILRNLVRKKEELTLPDPETEPEKYFAVKYSVPEWLGIRLQKDWGEDTAARIASWRTQEPAITIRRNLMKTDEASFEKILEKKIWGREKAEIPGAWRVTGAMDISRDADFLAGNFSIQSESSMMVCLAVGPRRGSQVLDCCAAPGGKSSYLSELMGDTGRVQAWDIHEHRVKLITAQQKRLGLENIRPIQRDAAKFREDLVSTMDAVLLDAPCSGLGVLAEKPDIKLRITEEGVAELTALQGRLLETVSRYVRPGGILVYSTCSILKAENEDQVRAFLAAHPEFTPEPLPETIPEKFRRQESLGLQLLPHRDGVEGFYLCRMRRSSDEQAVRR